ncbi:MAG: dockerin type I repeat-containing protein, partial [Planctomycetota bacterium]
RFVIDSDPECTPDDVTLISAIANHNKLDDAGVILRARWGQAPTRFLYDAARQSDLSEPLSVSLPMRRETLHVEVLANRAAGTASPVQVILEKRRLSIDRVFPARGAADEFVDVEICGAGFTEDTQFFLNGEGQQRPAISTVYTGRTKVTARFELVGLPIASYTVFAQRPIGDPIQFANAQLIDSFDVVAPGPGELEVQIRVTRESRVGETGLLELRYRNIGSEALLPPLFRVAYVRRPNVKVDTGVRLRLAEDEAFREDALHILGVHTGGGGGVLPPSAKWSVVPIAFQASEVGDGDFRAQFLTRRERSTVVDWSPRRVPPGISQELWERAAPNMGEVVGRTWGEYHDYLIDLAGRLAPLDLPVHSVPLLFGFAVREAAGLPTSSVRGRVFEPNGTPVVGVDVVGVDDNTIRVRATTDASGEFVLQCVEARTTYRLFVPGYTLESPVNVSVLQGRDLYGVELVGTEGGGVLILREELDCGEDVGLPEQSFGPPDDSVESIIRTDGDMVAAIDPNTKDGPVGEGKGDLFVDDPGEMAYSIRFANELPKELVGKVDEDNLVPARKVEIFDTLEDGFDISTFRFGTVQINGAIPIPLESPFCYTGAELPCVGDDTVIEIDTITNTFLLIGKGQAITIDVFVTARFDFSTREASWTLETDHPDGFLPPRPFGSEEAMGSGVVTFAVEPVGKDECDELENEAKIRFDVPPDGVETDLNRRFTNTTLSIINCPLPGEPTNPVPPDSVIEPVSAPVTTLAWTGDGRPSTSYDVAIWPDDDPGNRTEVSGLSDTEWSVPGLSGDVLYAWQVTAQGPRGSVEGPVWLFVFEGDEGVRYVRGDVNAAGSVNITDAIVALSYLFLGGVDPVCLDAADVDGDGSVVITDPIYLLNWLFLGGSPPPAPTPSSLNYVGADCQSDPVSLGCEAFPPCS